MKLPIMMLPMASANAEEPKHLRRRLDVDRLLLETAPKADQAPKNPAYCAEDAENRVPETYDGVPRWFFNEYGQCETYRRGMDSSDEILPDANSFLTKEKCQAACKRKPKHVKAVLKNQMKEFLQCTTKECEIEHSTFSEDIKQFVNQEDDAELTNRYTAMINRMFWVEEKHDTCVRVSKRANQLYFVNSTQTLTEEENEQINTKLQKKMSQFFQCKERNCADEKHNSFVKIMEKEANISDEWFRDLDESKLAYPTLQNPENKSAASWVHQNAMLYLCKMKTKLAQASKEESKEESKQ